MLPKAHQCSTSFLCEFKLPSRGDRAGGRGFVIPRQAGSKLLAGHSPLGLRGSGQADLGIICCPKEVGFQAERSCLVSLLLALVTYVWSPHGVILLCPPPAMHAACTFQSFFNLQVGVILLLEA